MSYILAALLGYALGCLSPAYLLARRKGFDIRSTGSQNAGASNAFITMGAKSGVAVGLCDMAKSCAAALLAAQLFPSLPGAAAVAGTAAVLGHIFPFYLKFRGGKGFAPFLGLTLALDWQIFPGNPGGGADHHPGNGLHCHRYFYYYRLLPDLSRRICPGGMDGSMRGMCGLCGHLCQAFCQHQTPAYRTGDRPAPGYEQKKTGSD